jgi:hypothetical protein
MKKPPIPIGYFQDSGETTRLLLALMIAHAERNKIEDNGGPFQGALVACNELRT